MSQRVRDAVDLDASCWLPSDVGVPGAIPLPEPTWYPTSDGDVFNVDWATQNREINALLAGRVAG